MSRRNGQRLDMKLNLSQPRVMPRRESPNQTASESPPSSCVSSEENLRTSIVRGGENSPEATSMMLVGCPRCLMYVMLAEDDPRCPKCKSTVLLDVGGESSVAAGNRKNKKR
ncbi:protein GL2-INTERACTING REPRESSOR 1-like [Impatiens glandulifera]|uniref:protein GL2-INTERACTING REPRESSOR 1-like n=1 Tax=Impatiens glandulifera TaxID=253017 RepID=UPI001FB11CD4|nr:protein GL2-INTERACTING REPRESSOR 1-like [Impatiens glandulifera]